MNSSAVGSGGTSSRSSGGSLGVDQRDARILAVAGTCHCLRSSCALSARAFACAVLPAQSRRIGPRRRLEQRQRRLLPALEQREQRLQMPCGVGHRLEARDGDVQLATGQRSTDQNGRRAGSMVAFTTRWRIHSSSSLPPLTRENCARTRPPGDRPCTGRSARRPRWSGRRRRDRGSSRIAVRAGGRVDLDGDRHLLIHHRPGRAVRQDAAGAQHRHRGLHVDAGEQTASGAESRRPTSPGTRDRSARGRRAALLRGQIELQPLAQEPARRDSCRSRAGIRASASSAAPAAAARHERRAAFAAARRERVHRCTASARSSPSGPARGTRRG